MSRQFHATVNGVHIDATGFVSKTAEEQWYDSVGERVANLYPVAGSRTWTEWHLPQPMSWFSSGPDMCESSEVRARP